MKNLWSKLFLEERPSISLAFFRVAVALTVGSHVLPTFFPLRENYLSGAFKVLNSNFFTVGVLELVQQSPDALVVSFVAVFCLSWFFFLIGYRTQLSCIVMTLSCYYFYALNAFAVGTLSWDILLVTLFLMCLTPYCGDYFSLDSVLRRDALAFERRRPFFIQRLLQMQVAFTYFYTGLYKITADGNWLSGNPIYYLLLTPSAGVTKYFLLRDFFSSHPQLCYVLGVIIVVIELLMPFLLFNPSTRVTAIYLGFIFHLTLILTLDVPAIFFFLFPAQLLLFIVPDKVIDWIKERRAIFHLAPPTKVVFDGHCQFCCASVEMIKVMDLFGRLTFVDYQTVLDFSTLHRDLTKKKGHSQLYLIDSHGDLYGGFFAFRRMTLLLPMLYPTLLLVYFPGASILGSLLYRWVAQNRYLFHSNKKCANNACLR
ncbi:MAG: DUF393 domain-containing protein [Candidatus Omnitrophica bacterium]|nr:DUF393 domain-containing protein [Candidatus Omnitrophota bacterium]